MNREEKLRELLKSVYDAGVKCGLDHNDDDTYDVVRFNRIFKSVKAKLNILDADIWNDACKAQMNEVYDHCQDSPQGTNGHAIKHWVKQPQFKNKK